MWSVAGSDGLIHEIEVTKTPKGVEVKGVREYKAEMDNQNVCLMHDSTRETMAGCYQDGSVVGFDRET